MGHAITGRADSKPTVSIDLERVQLQRLMERSSGSPNVAVAILDGPVAIDHPGLAGAQIRPVGGSTDPRCTRVDSYACRHGTFIAGILAARRDSGAPAICPGCTLLVRPIFWETTGAGGTPSATPEDLADAIVECVRSGARLLNLSPDPPIGVVGRGEMAVVGLGWLFGRDL